MSFSKYTQAIRVGMLSGRQVIHVEHRQPVTAPMSTERRVNNYLAQNGDRPLSVRQLRQVRRMRRRNSISMI